MRQIDAAAIETLGIPRLLLMDHAGLAIARAVRSLAPEPSTPIVVCSGIGFNGGDGLAAARHLHGWGHQVQVIVAGRRDRLRDEPARYAEILQRMGLSLTECAETGDVTQVERTLAEAGVIVDALLGLGSHGAVREPAASLIACMNRSGRPIVAADLPSGLDADTGLVQGRAVRATVTVTFGLSKQGCVLADGPSHVGSLVVDPITIPQTLLSPSSAHEVT